MNAARLPSGESSTGGAPLRDAGARISARTSIAAPQRPVSWLQSKVRRPTRTRIRLLGVYSNWVNGSWLAWYLWPVAAERPAAMRAASNAGARERRAGSTTTNSEPAALVVRYQKRSFASQVG